MWKDSTSYSQSDRERKEPTAWSVNAGGVRLTVTKAHIRAPGEWVMHCPELGMDTVSTGLSSDQPATLAQNAAKNMAAARAREIAVALSKIEANQ